MAKALTLRDLFMKISNVFSKDMYIINYRYAIAGHASNELTRGYYMCIIEPHFVELLKKEYPDNNYIFIDNVKLTKDNFKLINVITDEIEIKRLNYMIDLNINQFKKELTWEGFKFTDDDIKTLFVDNQSLILFEDRDDRSGVVISKSIFPLVTEKTLNNLVYAYDNYKENKDLEQLLVDYDFLPYFQLHMRYLFLPL